MSYSEKAGARCKEVFSRGRSFCDEAGNSEEQKTSRRRADEPTWPARPKGVRNEQKTVEEDA